MSCHGLKSEKCFEDVSGLVPAMTSRRSHFGWAAVTSRRSVEFWLGRCVVGVVVVVVVVVAVAAVVAVVVVACASAVVLVVQAVQASPVEFRSVNARNGSLIGAKLEVFMVESVGAAFRRCAPGDEPTGSRQARRQGCPGDRNTIYHTIVQVPQ